MASSSIPYNSAPEDPTKSNMVDSVKQDASHLATRGAQLLQGRLSKLPGLLNTIRKDVFPAATGRRVALSAARNINSRVKKRALDAALKVTPYGKAIQAASIAWENRKAIAIMSLPVLLPIACVGIVVIGSTLNVLDTMQNNPFSAVDSLVRIATGRPVTEEVGAKICQNIKERPGLENAEFINCDDVAELTNVEELVNN